MVFLLPLGVMAHNHMVKHLLKVVMELHLLQVAMEGLLLLVVMVRLLVVMEVRLLQEDMEGILLQVDMGHNLPQLDMDPTLDISPHNRTIAHKVPVFPQTVFIHLIFDGITIMWLLLGKHRKIFLCFAIMWDEETILIPHDLWISCSDVPKLDLRASSVS